MSAQIPLLKYCGSKWKIASWVIGHFPPHRYYLEPFGGLAAVLLQKNPCEIETYNDLNGDLVNFFGVLRDRPDELIRAIELTPFARTEHTLAYQPASDSLERARRLYVRCQQSFGTRGALENPGWASRSCNGTKEDIWSHTNHLHLIAKRLRAVQIESQDAIALIQKYATSPDCLVYCDPPYTHDTRTSSDDYAYEMTDSDHARLAAALQASPARAIVSGYDSPLYAQLYAGWGKSSRVTNGAAGRGSVDRTECLWVSPNCYQALPLFAWGATI